MPILGHAKGRGHTFCEYLLFEDHQTFFIHGLEKVQESESFVKTGLIRVPTAAICS